MARKKVDNDAVKPIEELSFFECNEILQEINAQAEMNEGELTDEQFATLVEAQTAIPNKLHKLCNFIKLLEAKEDLCKNRIDEIKSVITQTHNLRERLCAPLAVWVDAQGKSYHVAEYVLKTRVSTSTSVPDGFDDPMFCTTETKVIVTPDKKAIKEALQANEEVPGCELITKLNLSIK